VCQEQTASVAGGSYIVQNSEYDSSAPGHTYDVWYGPQSTWDTVTYEMTSPATSVSNLDIGTLAQDSVSRGYTKSSWYLIDVEKEAPRGWRRSSSGRCRSGHSQVQRGARRAQRVRNVAFWAGQRQTGSLETSE
jgi:hypothetical protein